MAGVLAAAWATRGPGNPEMTPAPAATVLVPADGSLTVAGTPPLTVKQLLGACQVPVDQAAPAPTASTPPGRGQGSSCAFSAPGPLKSTSARVGQALPLQAEKSRIFTVAAVRVDNPAAPARLKVKDGALDLTGAEPGKYRVSLLGDAGGAWQFDLTVTR